MNKVRRLSNGYLGRAAEGNLKTQGEAITRSVSLAEASGARHKESAEERQARDWLARAKEEE